MNESNVVWECVYIHMYTSCVVSIISLVWKGQFFGPNIDWLYHMTNLDFREYFMVKVCENRGILWLHQGWQKSPMNPMISHDSNLGGTFFLLKLIIKKEYNAYNIL